MPIEKLGDVTKQLNCYNDASDICITFTNKINELIDAYNTREKDRSEQMARVLEKIRVLETDQDLLIDTLHSSGALKPFSGTHPKENEPQRSSLGQFFHDMKQEEDPELLNCLWCDVWATFCEFERGPGYSICCSNLLNCPVRAETKLYKTKQEAVSAWNKRV